MDDAHPYRSMKPPLAPPPRRIPLAVRLPLQLGGGAALAGWVLIALIGFFGWREAPKTDFTTPFLKTTDSAPARLLTVKVESHIGGRHPTTTWLVDYTFLLDGQTVFGRSYTSDAPPPREGETLTAEFPHGAPDRSCLHGMRRKPGSLESLARGLFFVLTGAALVVLGTRKGRRGLVLLREGEVARAKLVAKEGLRFWVNHQQVFRLRFQFEADDGRTYDVVTQTSTPRVLEDEPTEQVLYLPSDPRWATLVDDLPGRPRVRDDGTIAPGSAALAFVVVLFAAAAIAANAAGAWIALTG